MIYTVAFSKSINTQSELQTKVLFSSLLFSVKPRNNIRSVRQKEKFLFLTAKKITYTITHIQSLELFIEHVWHGFDHKTEGLVIVDKYKKCYKYQVSHY